MKMIENLDYADAYRSNTDNVYDFIVEYMSEVNFKRHEQFKSINNIVKWLGAGFSGGNGRKKMTELKIHRISKETLKPGTRIKIPLSNINNVPKFHDVESAKAHMNSAILVPMPISVHSNSDDSDEIDVITPDIRTQWNNGHNFTGDAPQNFYDQQLNGFTQQPVPVKSSTQSATKRAKAKPKPKRPKTPDQNRKESKYPCNYCDKYYQQKSSLHRHEKGNHPNEIQTCAKRSTKGHVHTADIVSTNSFLVKTNTSPCILSQYSYYH